MNAARTSLLVNLLVGLLALSCGDHTARPDAGEGEGAVEREQADGTDAHACGSGACDADAEDRDAGDAPDAGDGHEAADALESDDVASEREPVREPEQLDGEADAEDTGSGADADAEAAREAESESESEDSELEEVPGIPRCRPGDRPLALARDRGELQPLDWPRRSAESAVAAPCDVHAYRFAGAAGMELRATLTPLGAERIPPRLQVFGARAITDRQTFQTALVDENSAPGQPASGTFVLEQSGEYLLVVGAADLTSTGAYAAEVECLSGCDKEFTRYPIVLLHGSGGFDSAFHLDYFFQIKDTLVGDGYSVHSLDVASLNGSAVRAATAGPIIDEILAQTGAAKVNLIGHSQGGLDARYLISTLGFGDRVGVAVLLATPNQGCIIADIILGYVPGFAMDVIAELVDVYGIIVGTGTEQDTLAAVQWLSAQYMQGTFNPNNPDDPRVAYWSWAGETCALTDLACQASHDGEVVEPALATTYRILRDGGSGEHFGISDGLVVPASARWGEFQGVIFADHMDEVGQIADLNNQPFDHLEFFREVARKMYREGF